MSALPFTFPAWEQSIIKKTPASLKSNWLSLTPSVQILKAVKTSKGTDKDASFFQSATRVDVKLGSSHSVGKKKKKQKSPLLKN